MKENLLRPRPANLSVRNFTIFVKANTERDQQSKPLPSVCQKRGARVSNCRHQHPGRFLEKFAGRRNVTIHQRGALGAAIFRAAGRGQPSVHCAAKDRKRPQPLRFRVRPGRRPGTERLPSVLRPAGKPFVRREKPACRLLGEKLRAREDPVRKL